MRELIEKLLFIYQNQANLPFFYQKYQNMGKSSKFFNMGEPNFRVLWIVRGLT